MQVYCAAEIWRCSFPVVGMPRLLPRGEAAESLRLWIMCKARKPNWEVPSSFKELEALHARTLRAGTLLKVQLHVARCSLYSDKTLDEFEMRRYSEWKLEVCNLASYSKLRVQWRASLLEVGDAAKRLHLRLLRRHDRSSPSSFPFLPCSAMFLCLAGLGC